MLRKEDGFSEQIDALLEGRSITIIVGDDDYISYYRRVSDMSMSQLWTFIYYVGYLTIAHPENRCRDGLSDGNTNDDGRSISLRIPNLEIQSVCVGWLRGHIRDSIRTYDLATPSKIAFNPLIQGDFPKFAHGL